MLEVIANSAQETASRGHLNQRFRECEICLWFSSFRYGLAFDLKLMDWRLWFWVKGRLLVPATKGISSRGFANRYDTSGFEFQTSPVPFDQPLLNWNIVSKLGCMTGTVCGCCGAEMSAAKFSASRPEAHTLQSEVKKLERVFQAIDETGNGVLSTHKTFPPVPLTDCPSHLRACVFLPSLKALSLEFLICQNLKPSSL